ncbi:Zinc finger, C2H2 type family protein [Tritrichomonas foetus]|uniref:Zinc finger, C2H2 type family protein n=1 Tax=Tritrichomonas foetus TaxID=1144522 RepID=A0A1J4J9Q6_9EUKA|nr:Zinc finger, C2H2 type family protein [Tritrichomonas foetus]|eukprot:OHS95930.1 Zinc finger, C2H2 type family protein [Tritrichomonas foetus]
MVIYRHNSATFFIGMKICFSKEKSLKYYGEINAEIGKVYEVEYFKDKIIQLIFLSTNSKNLHEILNEMRDGYPISADFEWKPDKEGKSNPISIFQFASSKKVVVVENDDFNQKNDIIQDFLLSNKLFGKGTRTDILKLHQMFHQDIQIEDIEATILKPNNLPLGFSTIVKKLIGKPLARFKDPRISCSDWSHRPITIQQLLYCGFDAYAMYLCYQKLKSPDFDYQNYLNQPENNSSTTRKLVKTQRSIKLKTKFIVEYSEKNELIDSLRKSENSFLPHKEYNTKYSLFYAFLAQKRISMKNHYICKDCQLEVSSENEIIDHLWNFHFNEIPSIYFVWQSPDYLKGCIKQIEIASNNLIQEENHVKCKECGKTLQEFRGLYTHCRMFHSHSIEGTDNLNLKLLLYEFYKKTKKISYAQSIGGQLIEESVDKAMKCEICDLLFIDENKMIDHCWNSHSEVFISLWKHRPSLYPDCLYDQCHDLGIIVIEKMLSGTIFKGIYTCAFCLIGFDSPGELFIHLFHRHTVIKTVTKNNIDLWPIKINAIPVIMTNVLKKLCFDSIVESLDERGIFNVFPTAVRCNECNVVFDSVDEEWEHILNNHIIIDFGGISYRCHDDLPPNI